MFSGSIVLLHFDNTHLPLGNPRWGTLGSQVFSHPGTKTLTSFLYTDNNVLQIALETLPENNLQRPHSIVNSCSPELILKVVQHLPESSFMQLKSIG